jgi:calcineurin-binding protein cabin-1
MSLKNFQLARHAFNSTSTPLIIMLINHSTQGLQCSPNHWPCLDGIISVLFGLGDDVLCLNYINIALGKDSLYTKGLILRDSIFQISPSLKIDLKQIFNEKWYGIIWKKTQTVFNNPSVTFCPLGSICLKTILIVKKKRRNV